MDGSCHLSNDASKFFVSAMIYAIWQQAETYAAPHSEPFVNSTTLPPPGTALSAHHEIQLLREQLEQQRQQTQAAVAQLQLAREQMQAEQVLWS